MFNGTIYVHKAAQKSNAKQTNKNLLLSPEAWINTKPQLEIYNNDVKCGHGSTIGRLDEEALFYLRCRGIGLEQARSLLTYAFASEMLNQIDIDPCKPRCTRRCTRGYRPSRASKGSMSIASAIYTPSSQSGRPHAFDVERIRQDFPLLHRTIRGKPLVYLDNAATSQKPQVVLRRCTTLHGGKRQYPPWGPFLEPAKYPGL